MGTEVVVCFVGIYTYVYKQSKQKTTIRRLCARVGGGKKEAYNTCCSQAVTHPGTEQARRCLTAVIGREPVFSAWYGRRRKEEASAAIYL